MEYFGHSSHPLYVLNNILVPGKEIKNITKISEKYPAFSDEKLEKLNENELVKNVISAIREKALKAEKLDEEDIYALLGLGMEMLAFILDAWDKEDLPIYLKDDWMPEELADWIIEQARKEGALQEEKKPPERPSAPAPALAGVTEEVRRTLWAAGIPISDGLLKWLISIKGERFLELARSKPGIARRVAELVSKGINIPEELLRYLEKMEPETADKFLDYYVHGSHRDLRRLPAWFEYVEILVGRGVDPETGAGLIRLVEFVSPEEFGASGLTGKYRDVLENLLWVAYTARRGEIISLIGLHDSRSYSLYNALRSLPPEIRERTASEVFRSLAIGYGVMREYFGRRDTYRLAVELQEALLAGDTFTASEAMEELMEKIDGLHGEALEMIRGHPGISEYLRGFVAGYMGDMGEFLKAYLNPHYALKWLQRNHPRIYRVVAEAIVGREDARPIEVLKDVNSAGGVEWLFEAAMELEGVWRDGVIKLGSTEIVLGKPIPIEPRITGIIRALEACSRTPPGILPYKKTLLDRFLGSLDEKTRYYKLVADEIEKGAGLDEALLQHIPSLEELPVAGAKTIPLGKLPPKLEKIRRAVEPIRRKLQLLENM